MMPLSTCAQLYHSDTRVTSAMNGVIMAPILAQALPLPRPKDLTVVG